MRIDGASNSNAAVNTNVGDLMSRLDAGDVIRAKVIEITSDEAVLRLFDGTLMKAKLAEKLDASVGQTITLSVVSKSDSTLVLETVRDMNSRLQIKPDILKNILESLNLKPDNKNIEVAAELLKAGQPVTKDSIVKALQLMEAVPDTTADKAVFLSSKNINVSQLDPTLTSKLLNGDLKLGGMLRDLQNAIEQTPNNNTNNANNANNTAGSKNAGNMQQDMIGQSSPAAGAKSSQVAGSSSARTDSPATPAVIISGRQTSGTDVKSPAMQTAAADDRAALNGSTTASSQYPDAADKQTVTAKPDLGQAANKGLSGKTSDIVQAGRNSDDFPAGSAGSYNKSNTVNDSSAESNIEVLKLKTAVKGPNAVIGDLSADESVNRQTVANSASDAFSKMNKAVKEVFVSTDSDKLASELEVNKLYNELGSRLETVKAAAHASDLIGTKADIISNAANMISDTIRLIDQLNSGGLTYYQIPVKISDNNTTAELYIMKKQRNKKKIDPNNTVMFISLDTENLGRVETLIDVKGRNIGIQLRTEKQEINDYIKEYTKDLYNGLSDLGYKLTGIRFKVIDEPATPIKQERLLEEMEQGYKGRVDFRI